MRCEIVENKIPEKARRRYWAVEGQVARTEGRGYRRFLRACGDGNCGGERRTRQMVKTRARARRRVEKMRRVLVDSHGRQRDGKKGARRENDQRLYTPSSFKKGAS